MSKIVTVLNKTQSKKVGNVAVTYAPVQSCSDSCRFLNNGCYAQNGHCGFTFNRLSRAASLLKKAGPKKIALEELEGILTLPGDKPLRLHISGDCRTAESARILSFGAERYSKINSESVWTYTHSWRDIPRDSWGEISVLASCETFKEVEQANKRGYAACMVRYKPFSKCFNLTTNKITYIMIPCKEMIDGITCDNCKICFNDKKLLNNNKIICFFSHGNQKNKINKILKEV